MDYQSTLDKYIESYKSILLAKKHLVNLKTRLEQEKDLLQELRSVGTSIDQVAFSPNSTQQKRAIRAGKTRIFTRNVKGQRMQKDHRIVGL